MSSFLLFRFDGLDYAVHAWEQLFGNVSNVVFSLLLGSTDRISLSLHGNNCRKCFKCRLFSCFRFDGLHRAMHTWEQLSEMFQMSSFLLFRFDRLHCAVHAWKQRSCSGRPSYYPRGYASGEAHSCYPIPTYLSLIAQKPAAHILFSLQKQV